MGATRRVLIVDDDPEIATMLTRSLTKRGFSVDGAQSVADALRLLEQNRYHSAVLDLVMPGQDGVALAAKLRASTPEMRIAMLTGYANSPLIAVAEKAGATVFIKPDGVPDLVDFLRK